MQLQADTQHILSVLSSVCVLENNKQDSRCVVPVLQLCCLISWLFVCVCVDVDVVVVVVLDCVVG